MEECGLYRGGVSSWESREGTGNSITVIELMLSDGPEPSLAHLMDLIMLTTLGGRERTRAQHEELMAGEGYRLVRDTPLARVLPWRILEFQHG